MTEETKNYDCDCISCGKKLTRVWEDGDLASGPSEGVYIAFVTGGNYGSRVFDMDGYAVEGYVCDECFVQKRNRLWVHKKGERTGEKLSEKKDEGYARMDTFGPASSWPYKNGDLVEETHWVDGVQRFRSIRSEERSEIEKLLLRKDDDILISKELLSKFNAALRESEENYEIMRGKYLKESRKAWKFENERAKGVESKEVEAILDKDATAMSVKEFVYLKRQANWAYKLERWFNDHDVYDEHGDRVTLHNLHIDLMLTEEEAKKAKEAQKKLDEIMKPK